MIKLVNENERELSRWTVSQESLITQAVQYKHWHAKKGIFYAKGGAGIERNPMSLRKPSDTFGLRKVKGSTCVYKGLYRVKSKREIAEISRNV